MLKKYEHKLNGGVFEVRKRGEDDFNEVNKLNLRERVVGGYVVEEDVEQVKNLIDEGLCASVYTQWSDIEEEVNGVYTYDRKIRKID